MKKILLILVTMFSLSAVSAQLPDNSYAPDFTATDINGTSHNLYAYLDSGYTVVMDLSAAWCGPCWTVHQTDILQDLHDTYGPNGTNEMRVFYIESESTNTLDQLNGINSTNGGGANRATDSYGDWVANHTYPFIDNASIASAYQLSAFPTLYTICPERLTRVFVGSPAGGFSLSDFYDIATACQGPATTTIDPSLLTYSGDELAYCSSFDGVVTMQNHGTSALTAATIQLKQGTNVLATENWTGNLSTYQVATVSFTGVTFSPGMMISAEITSADNDPSNNDVSFSVDVLATAGTAIVEGMEDGSIGTLPSGVYADKAATWDVITIENTDFNTPPTQNLGGFEASSKSLLFEFFNEQTGVGAVVFDKLAIPASVDEASLKFSYAYAQYQAENDRLEVQISTDCGATWTSVFNEAGASLSTAAATTSFFVPVLANWDSVEVDLIAYAGEEVLVRFVGTTAYGNNLWVDDVNVSHKTNTASSINDIEFNTAVSLSPVPASTTLNVAFELSAEQNVQLSIISIDGKVIDTQVYNNAQNVVTSFNVADLENGVYFMNIATENGISTKKFVVNHN